MVGSLLRTARPRGVQPRAPNLCCSLRRADLLPTTTPPGEARLHHIPEQQRTRGRAPLLLRGLVLARLRQAGKRRREVVPERVLASRGSRGANQRYSGTVASRSASRSTAPAASADTCMVSFSAVTRGVAMAPGRSRERQRGRLLACARSGVGKRLVDFRSRRLNGSPGRHRLDQCSHCSNVSVSFGASGTLATSA
jgi:hypothetical protein